MRPSPTVATAKTGLGRSPQGTKTRSGSGDQRLPLEGKLPKRSLHFVQRSSPRRLMRCFDLYSAAGVRARSFPPHPADSAGICFTSPLKGKAKVLLQPGSKRSPHSVRRSSGRTPRTRSGLRCRYGSWSPVGTVQDRPRRQSRTALDTCHRHAAPPFLRKVPGFFRLERSESSFCQRVGAQSSLQAFCERKRRKDFGKVMA